jgi:hypothetical protein
MPDESRDAVEDDDAAGFFGKGDRSFLAKTPLF